MEPLSWLGILLGLEVLILIGLAVLRGELRDLERPKYEMLGQEPPVAVAAKRPGCLGIEDRIIRLGLAIASGYYASRLGWGMAGGWLLSAFALYLGLTTLVARDYLYKKLRIDTRLPEHRH